MQGWNTVGISHLKKETDPVSETSCSPFIKKSKRWTKQKNNILRGLQSASEIYRLSDRHLLTKFNTNFCG
jgi:hypothetical protein